MVHIELIFLTWRYAIDGVEFSISSYTVFSPYTWGLVHFNMYLSRVCVWGDNGSATPTEELKQTIR